MRWTILAVTLCLAAAAGGGCAPSTMTSRAASQAEVPIRFAHGGIQDSAAAYTAADDPRFGYAVRRATFKGDGEFAMFDLIRTVGDYGFPRRSVSARVDRMLRPELKARWGGSGQITGARTTEYQVFLLPEDSSACVGVVRSLAEHIESVGDFSQRLVTGFYCRSGVEQIGPEEAREVAGALQA